MLKAIWMTDLHFAHQIEILGHNPRKRLGNAIDHVNQLHSDADFCVVSGDLVNRGTAADYNALSGRLESLSVPILPMMGNHDNRQLLKEFLPLPSTCMDEFVQYSVTTPEGLILCMDTHKLGSDAGELCETRLAWLESQLKQSSGLPVFIFMHHPPIALGLPTQDADKLINCDQFLDLISNFDCVNTYSSDMFTAQFLGL